VRPRKGIRGPPAGLAPVPLLYYARNRACRDDTVYLALIKAIDRPACAAHLDPVNLIVSPRQFYDSGTLIRYCFAVLGPWIVSAHAKDLTLRGQPALAQCTAAAPLLSHATPDQVERPSACLLGPAE
jgi:hypothetical protein